MNPVTRIVRCIGQVYARDDRDFTSHSLCFARMLWTSVIQSLSVTVRTRRMGEYYLTRGIRHAAFDKWPGSAAVSLMMTTAVSPGTRTKAVADGSKDNVQFGY